MERMLAACCDMCPSVALCQLLLNLWSATAISAQATSAKQNSKKKKNISEQSNSYYSCYIWPIVQNQDSIQFFWAISSNVTQIPPNCCSFWCNLFKGPVWHILYSGSSSKMTKSIQVTHFLFFSNLNFENILDYFAARFWIILLQDFLLLKCRIQNCKRKKPRKYLRCFDAFCRNWNIGIKDNLWM